MRVVMIGPFAWSPKGTVSARAFFMARELVAQGHAVTILMPPYDNPAHSGWEWERDGVRLVNARLPTFGDSPHARLRVPLALAWRAARLQPDVVHVFKPVGYAGLSGLYLRWLWPRLPLVLDCDDWEGRGGWADINPYPRLWRRFFYWQDEWLARHADAATVASQTLESRMWGLGLPSERVFYLPNGPDRLFRERRRLSKDEQEQLRRRLGVGSGALGVYIGHISYGAEVSLLLEALPIVLQAAPKFRIVMMGKGKGTPAIQKQALRAGLAEHVIFTGWVDHSETPAFLAVADLALYPYRDALVNRAKCPSKITAYMAMGKPIIASAVGEIAAYLDHGRAGLLIEPGDARAFAAGIVTLLRDPVQAAELGQRAEQRIWACYDWAQQTPKMERAYELARKRLA